MQYLLAVHSLEGTPVPSDQEMQKAFTQVDALNSEIQDAGAWVFAGGLLPASSATVVRVENGTTTMTDGPFAETKEQLGGFWILRADDLDAALAWAQKCSVACMNPVEVRPFADQRASTGPTGEPVQLADQDRSRWDRAPIAEGHDLVRRCPRRRQPGPYQLQAATNAVHTDGESSDWAQVLALYDQLLAVLPTPVVALDRAVAVAEMPGPAPALAALDGVELPGYHLLPAIRADLLARLGRLQEAAVAYDGALALVGDQTERDFLPTRREELRA